jgi:hypothetical protein
MKNMAALNKGGYRKKSQQTPNRNGFLHKDNILEAGSVRAGMFCSVLLEDNLDESFA